MGWHWLRRLRHNTQFKPVDVPDDPTQWVSCKAMYEIARRTPRDFGSMQVARSQPLTARVVLHAKRAKGCKDLNRRGVPASNSNTRKSAKREAKPWLLIASPDLALSARQLITLYRRRMQIELSFRELKSHHDGQGFEDSLTRKGARIDVLLLLGTLASFATWLVGLACEAHGIDAWLAPFRSKRRLYSVMPLGREAPVRRWSSTRLIELINQLRHPSPQRLNQLHVPA